VKEGVRPLVGVFAAMAALIAVVSAGAGAAGPRITSMRVCTVEASGGGCAGVIHSAGRTSRVLCSFTASGDSPANAFEFWTYDGAATNRVRVPFGPGKPGYGSLQLDTGTSQPLPGGTYACNAEAGTVKASSQIVVDGPIGPVVDVAVCTGNQASRQDAGGNFPVCLSDQSAKPVAGSGGGSVVCDALFPDDLGTTATISLVREGLVVGTVRVPIDEPLDQLYLERPNRSKPTPLFPGSYECDVTVAGTTVAKHFTVVQGEPLPTTAAVDVLGELSELHVHNYDVQCVPLALLGQIIDPDPHVILLGMARIKGKSMLLDDAIVCDPLAKFEASRPTGIPSKAVLLALSVVAHEYGHTLGLKRENVVECFAARLVWKWVSRSDLGPVYDASAQKFLLDNSRRPPAYKLLPSCTLPG
jgi:hypothetical protein